MIVTVTKLREYVTTSLTDDELQEKLEALESAIRKYTNNNFQNRNIRFVCNAVEDILAASSPYLSIGDTIQISESLYNNGLYVIESKTDNSITLDKDLYDESNILVTKIEYPKDIQMGVIDIMRWKLKNESQNYDDNAEKDIQSETISRHSITYAKDASESDLSIDFGVPKKYVANLVNYKKARF